MEACLPQELLLIIINNLKSYDDLTNFRCTNKYCSGIIELVQVIPDMLTSITVNDGNVLYYHKHENDPIKYRANKPLNQLLTPTTQVIVFHPSLHEDDDRNEYKSTVLCKGDDVLVMMAGHYHLGDGDRVAIFDYVVRHANCVGLYTGYDALAITSNNTYKRAFSMYH